MVCDTLMLVSEALKTNRHRVLMDRFDMSASQYALLRLLVVHDGTLSMSMAIHNLNCVPSTVTTLSVALEDKGYMVKERPATNRRSVTLRVTPKGQAIYKEAEAALAAIESAWKEKLAPLMPVLAEMASAFGLSL